MVMYPAARLGGLVTGPVTVTGGATYGLLAPTLQQHGITLVAGPGNRPQQERMAFRPPPPISLNTEDSGEIVALLAYAGLHYTTDDSAAAGMGIQVFKKGREFAQISRFDMVTFDWDHTLGNYQIFETLPAILRAKMSKRRPSDKIAERAMTAIETSRPFLKELCLGLMVGFALKQGLRRVSEWKNYEPQVGLATHTWPDRLAVGANWFDPLIPLLEGLLPGEREVFERIGSQEARSILNLHHFLDYAETLLTRYLREGGDRLSPSEKWEILTWLERGKAHYDKPNGAFVEKWGRRRFLHIEDSPRIVQTLREANGPVTPLLVPQPYGKGARRLPTEVGEGKKVRVPALWESPLAAIAGSIRTLTTVEGGGSTMGLVLGGLDALTSGETPPLVASFVPEALPDGVVMVFQETPTSVGEFWGGYVQRGNELKRLIRAVRDERGGVGAVRRELG